MDFLYDTDTEFFDQTFKGLRYDKEHIEDRQFHDSVFENCSFVEATFLRCKFLSCTFRGCDLSLVRLPNTIFQNTQFKESKVIGVNWAEAHWPKSGFFDRISFFECVINYSTFIGLELERMQAVKCVARDVDFAEANLTRARFAYTDFSESRFLRTNLTEADFTGARNYAIHVNLNTLKKAKFSLPEAMSLLYTMDIVLVDPDEE